MNVINPTPIAQNHAAVKLRSTEQAEQVRIKSNSNVSNGQPQSNSQNESIRVIRVASDGIKVAEFGTRNQSISNGQSTLQQKPEEQYRNNQQLQEREELGGLLAIDLFA